VVNVDDEHESGTEDEVEVLLRRVEDSKASLTVEEEEEEEGGEEEEEGSIDLFLIEFDCDSMIQRRFLC
jgi:hypothetical protein